jgi:nucleoside-diphosphate-sugar epimerase
VGRVLVINAESMLGRHCCADFQRAGWTVLGTADLPTPGSGFVECDVKDASDVESVVRILGPDAIVNCARAPFDAPPSELYATHPAGTLNVLAAARHRPGIPVLAIGCGSEYGRKAALPAVETALPNPDSLFGASKFAQTQATVIAASRYQLPVILVRPFVVVGPGVDAASAIGRLFSRIHRALTGAFEQSEFDVSGALAAADFVDVRDVARAIRLLIENAVPQPGTTEVFNIATQLGTRLLDVASILGRHAGLKARPVKGRPDGWMVPGVGSFARLRKATGWSPEFTWRQSLEEICRAGLAVAEPVAEPVA